MTLRNVGRVLVAALMGLSLAEAKAVPWDVFVDPVSGSSCDVVNGATSSLVVFSDTGQLIVVSGDDLLLVDTFVDEDQLVYFNGIPSGEIAFAEDGDGFVTVWWLSPSGWVMDIDLVTQEAVQTDLLPTDFVEVPCNACELWDDPADCDEDLDGVPDEFDFCPGTPLEEDIDLDGCSCSQLDDDADTINNCFDLCPGTPLEDPVVDLDGCSCSQLDDDLDTINNCFDLCPDTPLDDPVVDLDGCSCSELDDDLDTINNCFDLCPDTPLDDPVVDLDGCSCSDLDDDLDGVDNCFDLCPDTLPDEAVDEDGCTLIVIAPPPVTGPSPCGSGGTIIVSMLLFGFVGLKLSRRP